MLDKKIINNMEKRASELEAKLIDKLGVVIGFVTIDHAIHQSSIDMFCIEIGLAPKEYAEKGYSMHSVNYDFSVKDKDYDCRIHTYIKFYEGYRNYLTTVDLLIIVDCIQKYITEAFNKK